MTYSIRDIIAAYEAELITVEEAKEAIKRIINAWAL